MELEKLILLNKRIKRRLTPIHSGKVWVFRDGRGRIVEASPIGTPNSILTSDVENPWRKVQIYEKLPYFIDCDVGVDNIRGHLKIEEARIVLGVDSLSKAEKPSDMHAMLEACSGGPGLSNAYVLGGNYSFDELKKPERGQWLIVPVQYYSIKKSIFDSLALTSKEKRALKNDSFFQK